MLSFVLKISSVLSIREHTAHRSNLLNTVFGRISTAVDILLQMDKTAEILS